MMKRFVFILLSIVLLASQINLSIGTHYCGGEAVTNKLMMVDTDLGCGMAMLDESCDITGHQDSSYSSSPCCENHYQTIETTDNFVNDAQHILLQNDFIAILVYSILHIDLSSPTAHYFYADYASPPLEKDIQILFQTFII